MLRVLVTVVAAIFTAGLLAAAGIGAVGAQDTVTLEVVVVDDDGDGVGNVDVTATWDDDGETTASTFSDGGVRMSVPADTDLEIRVDHDDYIRNNVFEHTTGAVDGTVEVPVRQRGRAQVTVQDTDGNPVNGATVTLLRDGEEITSATVEGERTNTPHVERGDYEIRVEQQGYFDHSGNISISAGLVTETVTLEAGEVDMRITVTDDHFDPPRALEDAQVQTNRGTLSTGSSGQVRFADIPVNQDYDVTVTKEDYEEYQTTIAVGEEDAQEEVSIRRLPDLNLAAANQRVVVGETVRVDATNEYGEAVAGATVLLNGNEVTETDVDGQANIQISDEGEQDISVEIDGLSASVTVEGIDPDSDDDPPEADDDDEQPDETDDDTTEETDDDADDTDDTDDEADDDGPGFGALVAVVALIGAALLAHRR